jgi:MoaA/NifB/PqqE/SkfB family radical SAM enzyme
MSQQRLPLSVPLKLLGQAAMSQFAPRLKHMVLHVTNICNMRCQHCFVDFSTRPNDLKLGEFEKLSQQINDLVWLDIGGGEPSLRKDLPEIVSLFRADELSIPTNGWYVDRVMKIISKIAEQRSGQMVVTISLDGFRDTHDEIRQKGSFDRALETIKQIASLGTTRIKINTCVCERNADEIPSFMRFVRETLPVDFQGLLLLRGDPINPLYRLPPTERLRTIGDEVRSIQQSYSYGRSGLFSMVQQNFQKLKWELQLETIDRETQVIPCLGGQSHVVVYANGDVAPCEILPPIGSIRKASLGEIVGGEDWKRAVRAIKAKECNCTHDCNMLENILFNPRTYPRLFGLGGVQ